MIRGGVFVTGATGFIGKSLLPALLRERHGHVVAATRREGILPPGVESFQIDDLERHTDWSAGLAGCECVIHLAARVHVMADRTSDPLAAYRRANVAATGLLANQAAAAGVRRFVFISTIKVNGEGSAPGRPFDESCPPAPVDPYGISKAEAERELFDIGAASGMEVVVIRPPLVYGPGVRANFLSMARWLRRGVPLPLGSINANRRSLVGVDNLVDLIITCLIHPGAANQIFLAADGEDVSTTALLRRTAAAMGVRAHLLPVPPSLLGFAASMAGKRQAWQRLRGTLQVDITKARTRLDWNPPVSLDEGLRRALRSLAVTPRT